MASYFEQNNVVQFIFTTTAGIPKIDEFFCVRLVREKATPPRWLCPVGETKIFSQLNLGLTIAPMEIVKRLTLNPAFALG